ncbi:MAG: aspartate carbamoyltransferase [Candidatus Woesearchaeota archaeon]
MEIKEINPYEHVLESQQFDKEFLKKLFDLTKHMKQNEDAVSHELNRKIVTLLFYQPSTRTRLSFETAANKLGARVQMTENAQEFSSAAKGETLHDTIKTVNGYSDFIVIRHKDNDSSEVAANASTVPVINAGSGTGQHPTQALLDIYTIHEKFNKLENLEIAFIGDLARGRTVNSLVYLLSKFKGNKFYFVAPENSRIKQGIKDHLSEHKIEFQETENLNDTLKKADIVYMTRVQKEYFDDMAEYEKAKGKYKISKDKINLMKKDSILMHPLPRVDEISIDVDDDPRAIYFKQAKNGLYVRMALLKMLNDFHRSKKAN